jgi:hypothetical protein
MNAYHIALYVHLLAIVAASVAAALTHLSLTRATRAGTVGETLAWFGFGGAVAKVFPVSVLTLVISGGYMVSTLGSAGWKTGWVQAALAGAVLLFGLGGMIGARQGRAAMALGRLQSEHGPGHPVANTPDPVVAVLSWVNPGIALAVMFVMTTKPNLMVSGGILLLGIVLGLACSRVLAPKPAQAAAQVALD